MAGDRRYGTVQWKRTRLHVLANAGYLCQIQGPNRTGYANTVDHVQPVALGGSFFALANLRASCGPCNYGSGIREQNIRALKELVEDQSQMITQLNAKIDELERQLSPAAEKR
jgi:5-methylcytosine-specific restriction endonuclease McrA